MLDWRQIDKVFLDMDGTLLDLHFDDYFWQTHLPARYAQTHGLDAAAAKRDLATLFRTHEGTLNWYCLDFWSRELQVDVATLKTEVQHLIAIHEGVLEFLHFLQQRDTRCVLVTNAHRKALHLKMAHTELEQRLDRVISSHDLGLPKEDPAFWQRLHAIEPFDKTRTLFVDDSVRVLESAQAYGIKHLLSIVQPSSKGPRREQLAFPAIENFRQLID